MFVEFGLGQPIEQPLSIIELTFVAMDKNHVKYMFYFYIEYSILTGCSGIAM